MTSRLVRRLISIGIAVLLVASLAVFVVYQIDADIASSVDNKSGKSTTATVVDVVEIGEAKPVRARSNDQLFRICFTIDNFDQVQAYMRQGYQLYESQRLIREGPRCKVTAKVALAKRLKRGDKLSVVYLLENEYHIVVVSTSAFGENL